MCRNLLVIQPVQHFTSSIQANKVDIAECCTGAHSLQSVIFLMAYIIILICYLFIHSFTYLL